MLTPTALEIEHRSALERVGRTLHLPTWPDVPISWNRRLRRAGRAVIDNRRGRFQSAQVELSPAYFEVYPEDLPGILVHEAVHVGLAIQRRPFGHGPEFRRVCTAAGGLLHSRWLPGRVFRYRCPVCNQILERRRRASEGLWCADCVAMAEGAGQDAYSADRTLRLVETVFQGPEPAGQASQPVCDAAPAATGAEAPPDCTDADRGSRYPVGESSGDAPPHGAP